MILKIKLIIVSMFLLAFHSPILGVIFKIETLNIALRNPVFNIAYCLFISVLVIIGLLYICDYYVYIDMTEEEKIEYKRTIKELNRFMGR